jgi:hypothetical protein
MIMEDRRIAALTNVRLCVYASDVTDCERTRTLSAS